jgi:uncharacterized repeat protein (TIGR01451 family)/LPXTG-motif cell wall-anchored protein
LAITDTATITSFTGNDPNLANNQDSFTLAPVNSDLQIRNVLGGGGQAINMGGTAIFDFQLSNAGPSAATNVVVSAPVPAGLHLVSAMADQGTYDPATGIWNVGTVKTTTSTGSGLELVLTTTRTSPLAITATATITSFTGNDPNLANNNASVNFASVKGASPPPAAVPPTVVSPSAAAPPNAGTALPTTGFNASGFVTAGVLLVLGGVALVILVAKRRRRSAAETG